MSDEVMEEFTSEYNLHGDRVCNADLPGVSTEDVLARGCPTGTADDFTTGNTHDETSKKDQEEHAL